MKMRKENSHFLMYTIIICALIFSACGQDPKSNTSVDNTALETHKTDTSVPQNEYTFLTNGYWVYTHRIMVNEEYQGNPYENHWIKMYPDFRYERGKFDEILFKGAYKYDHGKALLELVPDDPRVEAQSEWKVLYSVDAIVFQGTHRFGNNNEQIKLSNQTAPPTNNE